jgi:hypothetical protein
VIATRGRWLRFQQSDGLPGRGTSPKEQLLRSCQPTSKMLNKLCISLVERVNEVSHS